MGKRKKIGRIAGGLLALTAASAGVGGVAGGKKGLKTGFSLGSAAGLTGGVLAGIAATRACISTREKIEALKLENKEVE